MTEAKTCTLDVPGAVLSHDVRANETSTEPVLLIIGSPMGADGFVTLAGHFPDGTVVTYDPRGCWPADHPGVRCAVTCVSARNFHLLLT
jgi:hypothetical protein